MITRSLLNDSHGYLITDYLDESLDIWAAPIGQDGIGFITHPDVIVRGIDTADIRDIYAGRIENWQQVGGSDIPLIAFTREDGAGIRAALVEQVLGRERIGSTLRIAPSDAAMRFAVARTRGAIGYLPISQIDTRVHALTLEGEAPTLETVAAQSYPLRTILYIAGRREPDAADPIGQHFRAFVGWMQSPNGQALIARYAAPLMPPQN